jgi:large subunit ribosomal protein L21
MSYAVIKTGGKQYRVEEGQTLLVERLPDDGRDRRPRAAAATPATAIAVRRDARQGPGRGDVVGHERGPKLRVFKFKPKRGYKRRTGHRQELTRLQVTGIRKG